MRIKGWERLCPHWLVALPQGGREATHCHNRPQQHLRLFQQHKRDHGAGMPQQSCQHRHLLPRHPSLLRRLSTRQLLSRRRALQLIFCQSLVLRLTLNLQLNSLVGLWCKRQDLLGNQHMCIDRGLVWLSWYRSTSMTQQHGSRRTMRSLLRELAHWRQGCSMQPQPTSLVEATAQHLLYASKRWMPHLHVQSAAVGLPSCKHRLQQLPSLSLHRHRKVLGPGKLIGTNHQSPTRGPKHLPRKVSLSLGQDSTRAAKAAQILAITNSEV